MYTHADFYDDFIPYWDDSTETELDHHETTEPTETENFDLPF
jgi:hypothetical protein